MIISMKMFTYILQWSVSNSYAIYQYLYDKQVVKSDRINRREFKRKIDESLIQRALNNRVKSTNNASTPCVTKEKYI